MTETAAVFLAVYGLLAWGIAQGVPMEQGRAALAACLLALASGVVAGASGLYQPAVLARGKLLLGTAIVAAILFLLAAWLCLLLVGASQAGTASLATVGSLMMGAVAGVALARMAYAIAARRGLLQRRLVIIGGDANEFGLAEEQARHNAFDVVLALPGGPNLAHALRPDRLRAGQVWAIVTSDLQTLDPTLRAHCSEAGVRLLTNDEFNECNLQRVECERLPLDWLASASVSQQGRAEAALRRGFDMVVAVPEAVQAYEQALRAAPSSALALRHAAALRANGQAEAATAALRAWLDRMPQDDEAGMLLSQFDIQAGHLEDAERRLDGIVTRRPDDPVALNNLAWVLGERGGEAATGRARALAERAYFLAPGPDVADTLGWILARSGQPAQAVPLLRQSAAARATPQLDPAAAYRLAFALNAAGEREEARVVLTPVLAQAPAFPGRAEAERLLAELNQRR